MAKKTPKNINIQKKMPSRAKMALEKIPGSRLARLAAKEIRLIKSQKIALVLIMLYPLLVIGSLGLAFAGDTTTTIDAGFFEETQVEEFDTGMLLQKLNDSNKVIITQFESEQGLLDAVRSKKARVGIVLKGIDPKTKRFIMDIYFDNSNMIVAEMLFEQVKTQMQIFGFSKARELIAGIWGELGSIKQSIGSETERVDEFIAKLGESEQDLNKLEKDLEKLDVEYAREALARQKQNLVPFYNELLGTQEDIDAYKDKIASADAKAKKIQDIIQPYKQKIGESHQKIGEIDSRLAGIPTKEARDTRAIIAPLKSNLTELEKDITGLDSEISSTRAELASIDKDLEKSSEKISVALVEVSETTKDINAMDAFVAQLDSTVAEVKGLIKDARAHKEVIGQKLLQSKEILNSFIGSLAQMEKITPEFLSNPMILNKKPLFGSNKLALVTPVAIVIVLLLTTVLLTGVSFVTEKKEGSYARMLMSTTPKIELFAGKILGQLVFGLIEAGIIIAIALTVFGATVPSSPIEVVAAICIITFAFIALGLLVTNFTKNQSTTILGALLLMMPMLFLSGMLLPLEVMNPTIQWVSQFLPLTAGNELLIQVMIKGNPLSMLWKEILILLVPAMAILAFTILNKKKQ